MLACSSSRKRGARILHLPAIPSPSENAQVKRNRSEARKLFTCAYHNGAGGQEKRSASETGSRHGRRIADNQCRPARFPTSEVVAVRVGGGTDRGRALGTECRAAIQPADIAAAGAGVGAGPGWPAERARRFCRSISRSTSPTKALS